MDAGKKGGFEENVVRRGGVEGCGGTGNGNEDLRGIGGWRVEKEGGREEW